MLGHEVVGSGPRGVIVLNDWICDTSTWSDARRYLDDVSFTWAFTDVRGYGRSLDQPGKLDIAEIAGDVLALADSFGWQRFALIGHSMTTLAALHLAQQQPQRIERAIVLTPTPPAGLGLDDATFAALTAVSRGDDAARLGTLNAMWGDRLSEGWVRFKLARWRATSTPEAVARYFAMFARDGLPDRTTRIAPPVLAVTGERDAEPMRQAQVAALLGPLCERLTVTPLADVGHYPMQEAPPLLVTTIERFLQRGEAR
jgi:pimeloyl-ACP methyl ester carboxylesterase